MTSVFRPRQGAIQRLTPNNNARLVAGGRGPGRGIPKPIVTPPPPAPPPGGLKS